MKKTRILAVLVPVLAVALSTFATESVSYADSGRRGGGQTVIRGSSGGGGAELVARRDVVTRSGSRGGYVRGGRGYSTRYVEPRHSHSHFSGSIWIGPSWGVWDPFWYPYYPYPSYRYYAPPTTVVVPQEPQQYILPESQQEETGYWYYCRKPEGYYPYVERCPSGWMKVIPDTTPPGEADGPDEADKEK